MYYIYMRNIFSEANNLQFLFLSLVPHFVEFSILLFLRKSEKTQELDFDQSLRKSMGDYRSKSYADGRMQMESYYGYRPSSNPHDFRSYSASYASSYAPPPPTQMGGVNDLKLKKRKSTGGSSSKSWGLNDPEFQRKKRVASYKVYSVEGKVKGSLRKSFRWLKDRYTQVVYGWR